MDTHVDASALEDLRRLVRAGAGVRDDLRRQEAQRATADDEAFIMQLVERHERDTLPFLIEQAEIRGRRVLEVGAGTGGLAIAMVRGGAAAVVAVEPQPQNAEAARCRIRAYGLEDRISVQIVPRTCQLPFPPNEFQVCVCSSVLQYVPDPPERQALVREMYRVVIPGGLLVITGSGNGLFPGGPHSSAWWSNLFPVLSTRKGHKRGVTAWELLRALPNATLVPQRGNPPFTVRRWRSRAATAAPPRSWVYQLAATAASGFDVVVCRRLDVPLEAFTPFLSVALRKPEATIPP